YRLNVIALPMPPLREMRDDIAEVASQLLVRLRNSEQVDFSPAALQALSHYDFPGNVRELENVIERALALCSDGIITPVDLQLVTSNGGEAAGKRKDSLPEYLDSVEREAILEALNQ